MGVTLVARDPYPDIISAVSAARMHVMGSTSSLLALINDVPAFFGRYAMQTIIHTFLVDYICMTGICAVMIYLWLQ